MTKCLGFLVAVIATQSAFADDLAAPPAQPQPSQQAVAAARAACDGDIQKFCAGVQPGGGRILACLKQHKDQVSDNCKQAASKALKGS